MEQEDLPQYQFTEEERLALMRGEGVTVLNHYFKNGEEVIDRFRSEEWRGTTINRRYIIGSKSGLITKNK
ncbi:MAG: hypothetical protein ABIF88_01455 [archaeon]